MQETHEDDIQLFDPSPYFYFSVTRKPGRRSASDIGGILEALASARFFPALAQEARRTRTGW